MRFLQKIRAGRHLLYRLTKNARLRAGITLFFSLLFHISYVIFQLFAGLYYYGRWFYALAFYDGLLAVLRFFLLKGLTRARRTDTHIRELKHYRLCGIALLVAMPALIVITALIVLAERPLAYRGITTLAVSLYTISAFGVAVFNIAKYRGTSNPLLSATKAVSLTTASVSALSLEIALLFSFGSQDDLFFRRIVTGLSGGTVCIFVTILSLHIIRKTGLALRAEKNLQNLRRQF